MTTLQAVLDHLDARYPDTLSESWDNTGLLLGDTTSVIKRGLTALTLTEDVADEAIRLSCDIVVTHHPILFRGAKRLTSDTSEGRIVLKLASAGVAVYSPHTRFDGAADGINHSLAIACGITDPQPIRPLEATPSLGAGRWGALSAPVPAAVFAQRVAAACHVEGLHVVDASTDVSTVAVACGAAGEFLDDAVRLGCDAFVVGEARFHTALEARAAGVSLFVPGHYGTERPAIEQLAEQLTVALPDITWTASEVETDPLRWVNPTRV